MIIWIASYPKSGNTWVRSFLFSYIYSEGKAFNFEMLFEKITQFPSQSLFNQMGQNPKNLLEAAQSWISTQEMINLSNDNDIVFLKTHNAMCKIENYPFTNKENTLGAIYIVRDPRDVLVSYCAHSVNVNYASVLSTMTTGKRPTHLPDDKDKKDMLIMGNWSENYNSWKNFNLTKKLIIKYEDLLLDPFMNFLKIIEFLNNLYGLKIDKNKIKKSIEATKFSNLQNLEKKNGFAEKLDNNELFFREGKIGQWKKKLDKKFSDKLEKVFYKDMKELNYL